MSEIVRALLEIRQKAKVKRLKIVGLNSSTLSGGSLNSPITETLRYQYNGAGILVPHAIISRAVSPGSFSTINPGFGRYEVSVADRNQIPILDAAALNYVGGAAIQNLHSYYENFDHATEITSDEFYNLSVSYFMAPQRIICLAFVATEYLF
jgi:hypothetical protein